MSVAVLLVEDVIQLRGVVSELLASLGDFTIVGEVGTEAEAKLWLDEHRGEWELAVIDLSGLTFLSSMGMGALVSFHRAVTRNGGVVRLAAAPPPIADAIRRARLTDVLDLQATVAAALGKPH